MLKLKFIEAKFDSKERVYMHAKLKLLSQYIANQDNIIHWYLQLLHKWNGKLFQMGFFQYSLSMYSKLSPKTILWQGLWTLELKFLGKYIIPDIWYIDLKSS